MRGRDQQQSSCSVPLTSEKNEGEHFGENNDLVIAMSSLNGVI